MGKLLLKSTLFIALLLAASQLLIRPFVYHPFWGDPNYIAKYDHFFSEDNGYTTVFIGSSRTFRHINPLTFDSIAGTKSFNFGVDAVACPFNYLLAKEILQSKQADDLDHILVELFSPQNNLTEQALHSDKFIFRYGWADFYFTMRATWQDGTLSAKEKIGELSFHFRHLIETSFRLGQVHRITNAKDKSTRDRLGENGRGFMNSDVELINNPDSFFIRSHNRLLQNPEILEKCARYSSTENTPPHVGENCFQYHWDYLLNLQNECAVKGIELVLIVQPLMTEKQVHFFNRFLPHIPPSLALFNYNSSSHYPAYYQFKNAFDPGHLNTPGAYLFTTTLATDFNQLRKNGIHE